MVSTYKERLNKYKKVKSNETDIKSVGYRRKKIKEFIIELRYTGNWGCMKEFKEWHTYSRYEKLKDAKEALQTCRRKETMGYEYRLKEVL